MTVTIRDVEAFFAVDAASEPEGEMDSFDK